MRETDIQQAKKQKNQYKMSVAKVSDDEGRRSGEEERIQKLQEQLAKLQVDLEKYRVGEKKQGVGLICWYYNKDGP